MRGKGQATKGQQSELTHEHFRLRMASVPQMKIGIASIVPGFGMACRIRERQIANALTGNGRGPHAGSRLSGQVPVIGNLDQVQSEGLVYAKP